MIRLRPEEQAAVSHYIHVLCGVTLDSSKGYLIEGRLGRLVEEAGCSNFAQFLSKARNETGRNLERRIIDAITTNETLFFRDNAPFDLLRHKIVPEVLDRRRGGIGTPLRIWSAACSTGQELYSIAIVLKELLSDPDRFGVRLVGTDISDDAVARASKGLYGALEVSRGLPDEMRARYFVQRGDNWQVRDEIRALASFKRLNLLQDFSALGRFDIIFCRNVAIYFNEADRRALFGRLERALEPEGYLIIGAMESLNVVSPQFESKRHLHSVFYQLKNRGHVMAPVAC
jgi:chemotaxis protein methyltransferase CheR